jgi:hypothetical protein
MQNIKLASHEGRHLRKIDHIEANRLIGLGVAGWFGKQLRLILQPQQAAKYRSNGNPSPTTLTKTDLVLNAETSQTARKFGKNCYGGIDEMIVGNAVDRAKSKVEVWPEVHDTKAVVISAGRVCQPSYA